MKKKKIFLFFFMLYYTIQNLQDKNMSITEFRLNSDRLQGIFGERIACIC